MRQVIGLKDIWELENLVEQVVVDMRATGYLYTSDGDSISLELSVEDRCRMLDEHIASLSVDVFHFVSNPTLTQITFKEAVEMELDYSKFLGHTQVGEVILIEKHGDTVKVACGWDDYVTKLQFTNEDFTVLETNLESAQLYYTHAVIKDLHRSLWKKISE